MHCPSCLLTLRVLVRCLAVLSVATFHVLLTPQAGFATQPLQPRFSPVHRPLSPVLPLERHAGLIFAGTVVRVERLAAKAPKDVETVAITFHVERGIRGVHNGQRLTIREWAGLWVAQPRYCVGERVVLFLYAPSRLGLTSPVGDAAGHFTVSPNGEVMISPVQASWAGRAIPRGGERVPLNEFVREVRRGLGGEQ